MRTLRSALLSACLLASTTALAESGQQPVGAPRQIAVDEAVKLSLETSPALKASRMRRTVAEDQSRSVRGKMLPTLAVNEEFQHYSEPFSVTFNLPLPHAPGTPAPASPSFTARDQNTNTFVVGAGQPVLGLLRLWSDREALEATAQSADESSLAAEAVIREAVETAYLRFFEAKATGDIAKTSEEQLKEQYGVAEAKLKAGVLTKADLLRLEVAAANAHQQEIQAEAQQQITRAQLLISMGFSPEDTGISFVEPEALEQAPVPKMTELEAQQRAFDKRHETQAQLYAYNSQVYSSRSRLFAMLPDVNLEAAYVSVKGQVFAPPHDEYIGVKASWNFWEWGSTWYAFQAARDQAQAQALNAEDTGRTVRAEASSRLFGVRASAAAVESAQAAIASAEESYRVSAELVRVGSATTTTELLDAQTALTQAKLNLVRARYEQAIAAVALRRAVGE